jgi:hypothetical protein
VTAHTSRCLLHRRGPYFDSDPVESEVSLPQSRDKSVESPLLEDELLDLGVPDNATPLAGLLNDYMENLLNILPENDILQLREEQMAKEEAHAGLQSVPMELEVETGHIESLKKMSVSQNRELKHCADTWNMYPWMRQYVKRVW